MDMQLSQTVHWYRSLGFPNVPLAMPRKTATADAEADTVLPVSDNNKLLSHAVNTVVTKPLAETGDVFANTVIPDALPLTTGSKATMPSATNTDATTDSKKKKKAMVEIPVELLMLAASGYLSTLNPALVSVITEQIDTSFFWNFNILDYAGMGFPRVSRSLKRGAVPYDPETDPETQRRGGLDKFIYTKHQQIKNANWANLWEEFLRESQNSPGALLMPAVMFATLPVLSRFTDFPAGRRAIQLGGQMMQDKHLSPLTSYLQEQGYANKEFKTPEERKQLLSQYYQSLFAQKDNPQFLNTVVSSASVAVNKPATLTPVLDMIIERPSEPIYTLTLEHLKNVSGKDSLPKFGEQPFAFSIGKVPLQVEAHPIPAYANKKAFVLSTQGNVTLGQLSAQWAESLAMLTEFQLKHGGVRKATFNFGADKALYQEHETLRQQYVILTNLLDAAIESTNKQLGASVANEPSQLVLGTKGKKSVSVGSFMQFANQADKVQDVLVSAFKKLDKNTQMPPTGEHFIQALEQTQHNMGAFKFAITIGAGVWMSWWMWTLAHVLQAGRAYPANRLVRSEGSQQPNLQEPITAPSTLVTTSPSRLLDIQGRQPLQQ
jgi:hypothetical protein